MGLTDEEDPIFVLEDGTVLIYSLFGTFKTSFSMGQDAKDMKILAARYSLSVSQFYLSVSMGQDTKKMKIMAAK